MIFRLSLPPLAALGMLALAGSAPSAGADEAAEGMAPAVLEATSPLTAAAAGRFGTDSPLVALYAVQGDAGLFVGADGGPTAAAEGLLEAMSAARRHALPPSRYGAEALAGRAARLEDADAAERAAFELAMIDALALWAGDLKAGLTTPRRVDPEIKLRPRRPEAEDLALALAEAPDPVRWLDGLAPAGAEYERLQDELDRIRELAVSGAWGEPVPAGPTLKPGMRNARVAALRARLEALGDLAAPAAAFGSDRVAVADRPSDAPDPSEAADEADPARYDRALVAAVKGFQKRHGLNADGIAGPATLGALNTTAAERAEAIAVNLERLRWLNRDLGERRVMVNIPAFTMKLVEGDRVTFESRVVVGKPEHQTPEFSDEIEHMVVNPTWNVPRSIATQEILPLLRRDPGYLERKNMRLVGAEPWFVDWHSVTPATFPGRIKQLPGPGNALGSVKFLFPNDNAIYLHDTPAKSLFAKDMRAHSHGCVRVEKPREFAEILLAAQTGDPGATFDRLRASGRERWVGLKSHLPVHLVYRTAWIEDGLVQFRGDIYGRDRKVMAALRAAGVSLGL